MISHSRPLGVAYPLDWPVIIKELLLYAFYWAWHWSSTIRAIWFMRTVESSLKVGMLTTSFPVQENASSGIFVAHLAQAIAEHCQLELATPASKASVGVEERSRLKVCYFRYAPKNMRVLAHLPGGIPAQLKHSPWLWLVVPLLIMSLFFVSLKLARRNRVVMANWTICGVVGGLSARIFRKKSVCIIRGEDYTRATQSILSRWLLLCCLRLNEKVLCVSSEMQGDMRAMFPSVSQKIDFIPNGVRKITPVVDRTWRRPLIVFVGSLIPRKDPQTVIEAFSQVIKQIDCQLVMLGDGPLMQSMQSLSSALCVDEFVEFYGQVSPERALEQIAQANALVLSSLSEGRPNVVLEAMANGALVFASDISGTRELIRHGENGFLFPVGDVDALVQQMMSALPEPSLCKRLSSNAVDTVSEMGLTWPICATRYCAVLQGLL